MSAFAARVLAISKIPLENGDGYPKFLSAAEIVFILHRFVIIEAHLFGFPDICIIISGFTFKTKTNSILFLPRVPSYVSNR